MKPYASLQERGFPVHEDIAAKFWSDGTADWIQLLARRFFRRVIAKDKCSPKGPKGLERDHFIAYS